MSSPSSLAKFSTLVGSVASSQPDARPLDPVVLVMNALKERSGQIALTDMRLVTQLRDEVILSTIEQLRSREWVEVVDINAQKFVRLTRSGYAYFF